MPTVSGSKLNSAQPSDIEFLSSFFTDFCAVLASKGTSNLECRGLYAMKWLLSELLSPGNAQQEPHTSQQRELDSDLEDETWVEEWEVQELLAWMLLETRAAGLPEESHHLVQRLERRLTSTPTASSESSSPNVTPSEFVAEASLRRGLKECNQPNLISSLPTELLYTIFQSVCSPRSLALFSPLILSHVNSRFRSIVLDMPFLWITIDDIVPLPIAKLYLERSQGVPLEIGIGSDFVTTARGVSKLDGLFLYLEPHAHRVTTLKVITMNFDIMTHLERLLDCGLPFGGLEKLEFGRCYSYYPSARQQLKLYEPSSLRELHLWSFPLDRDTFPTALHRLQLAEVAIPFEVLMAALECSPGLSVLVLDDCNLYGDARRIVNAAGLVDLQFIRIASRDIAQFASLIHTPALASLSVVGPSSTANTEFLVNLVKSSKEILSVDLCDYDLTESDWLEVFEHLPSLTHLRVRASYSSDQDLQALTITQTLPNPTSITLDNELRLTTVLVEQIARAHPGLESIVLRGWNPSNVTTESLIEISKLVKNIFVETFRTSPKEDCDGETESDSSDDSSTEESWLSGDKYVALNGRK